VNSLEHIRLGSDVGIRLHHTTMVGLRNNLTILDDLRGLSDLNVACLGQHFDLINNCLFCDH